jgi:hypothetical protein
VEIADILDVHTLILHGLTVKLRLRLLADIATGHIFKE